MFACTHHAPDPTSSSTLAKFPVAGLFPRFWAPPHFPALTYCFVLSLSFSQFHPFNVSKRQSIAVYFSMFVTYQLFLSNRIILHLRCSSTHSSCQFALLLKAREFFLCFLLYCSHCMLISYHNRQRLIIFAKIKETNGWNSKSRNYHIICWCQYYLTMQSK